MFINRIIKVSEILQKYYPADSILNKIPNYKYNNYYLIHDNFMGLITSTKQNDFKHDYNHIDIYTKEDIIAMKIHNNFFINFSEPDIAKYLHSFLHNLTEYSFYDNHHHL